jgi:hypothetical protein
MERRMFCLYDIGFLVKGPQASDNCRVVASGVVCK